MGCQWQFLLNILPAIIKRDVDERGKKDLQELRLRIGKPPELVKRGHSEWLPHTVTKEDVAFCVNTATRYSPWTSQSIADGFVTALGGHRIGICGDCVHEGEAVKNINHISSLCIRVARDFPRIAASFYSRKESILIIGRPGAGKTTFLRDLLRGVSETVQGAVVAIDERREIFPILNGQSLFEQGKRTDVLSGCKKTKGIEMALRTMSPHTIAMDEITNPDDCDGLLNSSRCGVRIIATAHAGNREEFYGRPVYNQILENHIFQTLVVIHPDQSWHEESLL